MSLVLKDRLYLILSTMIIISAENRLRDAKVEYAI